MGWTLSWEWNEVFQLLVQLSSLLHPFLHFLCLSGARGRILSLPHRLQIEDELGRVAKEYWGRLQSRRPFIKLEILFFDASFASISPHCNEDSPVQLPIAYPELSEQDSGGRVGDAEGTEPRE